VSRAVIALDVDGTLLDCRVRQVAVARATAPAAFDERAFWSAKRTGAATEAALIAAGLAQQAAHQAAGAWRAVIEDDEWLALDGLLPSALTALDALAADRRPVALLTARRRREAVRRQLDRLGVLARVDALVVVDPVRPAAAKADHLRRLGARAFVGDTESDAAAAVRAGVPFVAVASGQRSRSFLEAQGIAPVRADVGEAVAALVGAYPASATT
jgi:phosphoglycolate phosphatase-like HAD superfamily hydrolase